MSALPAIDPVLRAAQAILSIAMSPDRQRLMKIARPMAKLAIVAIVVWAVHASLIHALAELDKHTWQVHYGWLVASGVLYLAGLMPAALFWRGLLTSAGQKVSLGDAVRAFYASQLGKYVPGKAIVIVVRAGLVRAQRPDMTVVVASVFLETLTTMAAGSLLATVVLALWYPAQSVSTTLWRVGEVQTPVALIAAAMLVTTGLPTFPPVLKWLVRSLGVAKISPSAVERLAEINLRVIAGGWLLVSVGWLLQGASMWATLRGLGASAGGPLDQLPLHTAAVALAVVAGFLAFLPGGLGVREIVLVPLLAPRYGASTALVAAVMLRLVWLVAEVVVSVILYLLKPYRLTAVTAQGELVADEPMAA